MIPICCGVYDLALVAFVHRDGLGRINDEHFFSSCFSFVSSVCGSWIERL